MGFTCRAASGFGPQRSRPRRCWCFFQESPGPGGLRGEVGEEPAGESGGHLPQVQQERDKAPDSRGPQGGGKVHWTRETRTGCQEPGGAEGNVLRLEGPEVGSPGVPGASSSRPPPCRTSSTYLSTDSTNTLSALMWIQAIKASLKFTLSQRSRGPCGDRRAVTPPGCATQCHSKKGRGFDRASPELRRNARGRQKQRAGRTGPGQGRGPRSPQRPVPGKLSGQPPGTCAGPPRAGPQGTGQPLT